MADDYNGVVRDDNYLNYKSYSATQVIEINGALLWIKLQNGLMVGDIENIGDKFESAIKKLKVLARNLGVTQIYFQASTQTNSHALFAGIAQPSPAFQSGFKIIEGDLDWGTIKFTLADIDIF